jgi:hypothetical protein
MKVGVSGTNDLYRLAAALREAGERKLAARLDRGIHKAARVIEDRVHKDTDEYMPKGFERTFAAALTSKRTVSLVRGRSVTITFTAKGKKDPRKLTDMEQGRLRHPVYGRYRRLKNGRRMRNPWVTQRIKSGVISIPVREAQPEAVKVLNAEVAELTAELNRII